MFKLKRFTAILLVFSLLFGLSFVASAQDEADLPFADSEFFEMGDYSIHYRFLPSTGEHKGRIALIHGFISSTVIWEGMAESFNAAGYDCLLIDLPGFGYSTREVAGIDPIPREDLVAAIMEEVAPDETWILGGHSMGGGAALTVVNKYPDLIEALMLYAPVGDFANWGMEYPDSITTVLGTMLNVFWSGLMSIAKLPFVGNMVKNQFGYEADYDLNGRVLAPLQIPNTAMSMLFMMKRLTPIDYEITSQLSIPVLLCVAELDESVAPDSESALLVESGLPAHHQKVMFMGANHVFVEIQAEEVAAASLDFLSGN